MLTFAFQSWMPSKEVLAEVDAIREVEKAIEPEEKADLIDLDEKLNIDLDEKSDNQ